MPPFDCKDENSFGFSLLVDVRFKFCCVLLIWIKHSLLFRKTIEPPLTVTSPQRPSTATRLQWPFFFSWRTVHTLTLVLTLYTGADPGFFLGGGALVSCATSTPINHIVYFAENQLY